MRWCSRRERGRCTAASHARQKAAAAEEEEEETASVEAAVCSATN